MVCGRREKKIAPGEKKRKERRKSKEGGREGGRAGLV